MTKERMEELRKGTALKIAVTVSVITLLVPVLTVYVVLLSWGISVSVYSPIVIVVMLVLGIGWTVCMLSTVDKVLPPESLVNCMRLWTRFVGMCAALQMTGFVLAGATWLMSGSRLMLMVIPVWVVVSGSVLPWGTRWAAKADDRCQYPDCGQPIGSDPWSPGFTDAADHYQRGRGLIMLCGGCAFMTMARATYQHKWLMAEVAKRWPRPMKISGS